MIVNIGSIAGKVTLPWFTLYSATKFALGSLTEGLRMELGRDGIRTMVVCPGYVSTAFQSHALVGRPPDRLLKGKKFAITAEQCAEAVARGVERDARTVVTPAVGWAAHRGAAPVSGHGGSADDKDLSERVEVILKLKQTPGLYLIGFMASGKTTIGKLLADRLGWNFVDIDEDIEASAAALHRRDLRHRWAKRRSGAWRANAIAKRVRAVACGMPTVMASAAARRRSPAISS